MEKANLENLYNDKIVSSLLNDLGIKNIMKAPKLEKIVLNMGMGDAKDNKNALLLKYPKWSLETPHL